MSDVCWCKATTRKNTYTYSDEVTSVTYAKHSINATSCTDQCGEDDTTQCNLTCMADKTCPNIGSGGQFGSVSYECLPAGQYTDSSEPPTWAF